ncbi:ATP-binding cassette domain-containing protein [Xanthomonas arboricola]|uniref:ATP-binding cassette domain-containing protein n=1 Tax=Xanthomonas arboricola TaxID=56448 RepID=UPI003D18CA24
MSPSTPLLQVDHVSLEYASAQRVVRATHRVRFDVHEADRFVLLGPSGCGKSTLLKAVAGFVTPREGQIRLDGNAVTGPGPDRVVVFQEFDQLAPWKTVRENVVFGLRAARKLSRVEARERADDSLAQVGLSAFAQAYPVRRHEATRGDCARVGDAPTRVADGRAVRRTRCADAFAHAGAGAGAVGAIALHLVVRHPFDRGGVGGR